MTHFGMTWFESVLSDWTSMWPKFPKQFNLDKVDKAWGNQSLSTCLNQSDSRWYLAGPMDDGQRELWKRFSILPK